MLWAIDVGNTHIVVGIWDDGTWKAVWRLWTHRTTTEDELAANLKALFEIAGLPFRADEIVVCSVVPSLNYSLARLGRKWLKVEPTFVETGEQVGLKVLYDPPAAVGADRIVNAIAALEAYPAPLVIIDFGTATTFDAVSKEQEYLGGAIMPGVLVSMEALIARTARLPQFELNAPARAIGRSTPEALQAGNVLGYAGAVDGLVRRIDLELGGNSTVVATGGLAHTFQEVCETIRHFEPNLTIDGLRIALARMRGSTPD